MGETSLQIPNQEIESGGNFIDFFLVFMIIIDSSIVIRLKTPLNKDMKNHNTIKPKYRSNAVSVPKQRKK